MTTRIVLLLLLFGVCIRFYHLEYHVIWHDEVCTLRRVLGHGDLLTHGISGFSNDRDVIDIDLLSKELTPVNEFRFSKVWAGLLEAPEHPPLYYLLSAGWLWLFGSDIVVLRAFSILCSLAFIWATFLLSQSLFNSELRVYTSTALMSIAPCYFLFARFGREYILWCALVVLLCVYFIRAIEATSHDRRKAWGLYAVVAGLSWLTSYFTCLFLFAHFVYLFCVESLKAIRGLRWNTPGSSTVSANSNEGNGTENFWHHKFCSKNPISADCNIKFFLLSVLTSILFILPWIILSDWSQFSERAKWRWSDIGFGSLWTTWLITFRALLLFDAYRNNGDDAGDMHALYATVGPYIWISLLFLLLSYFFGSRHRYRFFVFINLFLPFATLALSDLVFGGIQTLQVHYTLPSYAFLFISVAGGVQSYSKRNFQKVWLFIQLIQIISLLTVSTSCVYYIWSYFNSPCSIKSLSSCSNPDLVDLASRNRQVIIIAEGTETHGLDEMNILSFASEYKRRGNINNQVTLFRSWEVASEYLNQHTSNNDDEDKRQAGIVVLFNPRKELLKKVNPLHQLKEVGNDSVPAKFFSTYRHYYYELN